MSKPIVRRPWLVLYRRTSHRTGKQGKWHTMATYATRESAVDGMIRGKSELMELQVIHRDDRSRFGLD